MVDINLLGDDKTGEEERVEDFTQTSSMDTQELAFEERTETFDTTKTAGFAHRRSYSSLISTLIIFAVIVLLGAAIYFFMFKDDGIEQAEIPTFIPETGEIAETPPAEGEADLEPELAETTPSEARPEVTRPETSQPATTQPATPRTTPSAEQPRAETQAPADVQPRSSASPAAANFLTSSKNAVQTVSSLLSALPSNLNATLLSYAGERVRFELVASSGAEVRQFANQLNQSYGRGSFTILSEAQVPANGRSMEKVLVSGRARGAASSSNSGIEYMSLQQARSWITRTVDQNGLDLRLLDAQPGFYSGGFQKTPLLVRVYGSQQALLAFLDDIAARNLNFEITKILLVSPDMVTYSDDNLVLVLNMFLNERS